MGFEAAIKVSLVVPTRLFDTPSHASSLTGKMGVYLYHKVPSLWSRGVNSMEEGGHRIFAGWLWQTKGEKGTVSPRELGFFVTVGVAIGLFVTGKLGLEITSILVHIHLKASLCQYLS